jgi:hypothetical protein
MTLYRRRPLTVEAFKWQQDIITMNNKYPIPDWLLNSCVIVGNNIEIFTLNGIKRAKDGEWIVKGPRGEMSILDAALFDLQYELVKE